MTSPITRRATPSDATDIGQVHRVSRAWYYGAEPDPADGREARWREALGEAARTTWVAELDGRTVGFLSMVRGAGADAQVKLSALYVLPEHAGNGIGSALYELFDAARHPDDKAVLEAWAGNARAIGFYVGRGWVPTTATRPGPQGKEFVTYLLDR